MNLPIGSIIAWHKSFANTPALPPGWVEMNGGTLDNPDSPYHGQTIPNLNGEGRFLRGGATSGVEQDDAMQGHWHKVTRYISGSGFYFSHAVSGANAAADVDSRDPTSDGVNGIPRIAAETRPKNASVVWIMKVSDTDRESRLIPIEEEDVHVNVNAATPQQGGNQGKPGVTQTSVSAGQVGMQVGTTYQDKRPLGRYRFGKTCAGSTVGGIQVEDELKLVFSYGMLSHRLGKPFNFDTCVFYVWNIATQAWDTLDAQKFSVASKVQSGAPNAQQLSAELWIKTADAGEYIILGIAQPD